MPLPEPGEPDYSALKASSAPKIVKKVERKLTLADIAAIKAKGKQQDQARRLQEVETKLAGTRKPDGRLLKEAKAILDQQGGGFYKWLAAIGSIGNDRKAPNEGRLIPTSQNEFSL